MASASDWICEVSTPAEKRAEISFRFPSYSAGSFPPFIFASKSSSRRFRLLSQCFRS